MSTYNRVVAADETASLAPAVLTQLATDLSGTFGTGGTLSNWRAAYGTDPTTATIAIVGDSTAEEANYPNVYIRLRDYHMQPGQLLGDMQTTNLTEGGNSGATLAAWIAGGGTFLPSDLWALAPDLVVYRWGTNDVRLGTTTQAEMIALFKQLIDLTRTNLPNTDIVIAVPPTFTTNVVGSDYLGGATRAQAQARSDALRNACLAVKDYRPNVLVWDDAAQIWGTVVNPSSPLMTDQLHHNTTGQRRFADGLAQVIGTPMGGAKSIAPEFYRWSVLGVVTAAGNGYIDIGPLDAQTMPSGKEFPLTQADILHIPGYSLSPLTLTGATFPATGNHVRILKGGTDFSSVATNTLVALVGAHPKEGVDGGRIQVTVDPGSIAAGGDLDVTVTVSGATTSCGVIVQPKTSAMATGLTYMAWVSATDTVTLRFHNSSGAAIDPTSGTWLFWLAR